MQLTKSDIKSMEEVGLYKGEPVFHIKTKGGFNIMAHRKASGELRILGEGGHRAICKAMADKNQEGIEWHESLFKTDDISTPHNHQAAADYHAKFSHFHNDSLKNKGLSFTDSHNHHMSSKYHENEAVKHYQMSGMDKPTAIKAHQAHAGNYKKNGEHFAEPPPPHTASRLESAYRMKHKSVPTHLPSNWAE